MMINRTTYIGPNAVSIAGVVRRCLMCTAFVLAVPSVLLAVQDDPPALSASSLAAAPADAWLVAHIDEAGREKWAPVFNFLTKAAGEMGMPLREALAEVAPGSITLAVTGLPASPFSYGITVAFAAPLEGDELMSTLAEDVAPAWNRSSFGQHVGEMAIDEITSTVRIKLLGKMPVVLACVDRDGIAYLSSTPGAVDAWLAGDSPGGSFVDSDDYARAVKGLEGPPRLMVHVNLRTIMPLAAASVDSVLGGLADGLSVGDVETLTLLQATPSREQHAEAEGEDPSGSGRSASRQGAKRSHLRLAVGVKKISPGPIRLLAPPATDLTLQRFYPRGTDLFVHGAMDRATDLVEDVAAIVDAIDPAIVREYDIEREAFRRETGLEPHAEFLANFAREWSFGGRIRENGVEHPLLAVRLRDGKLLRTHIRTLQVAFDLDMTSNPYRHRVIHHALRRSGPFSYAILDDVLLLSPEPQTVADAIDAALDGKSLADDRRFDELLPRSGPASRSVYVNAAGVASRFLPNPRDGERADPSLTAFARSGGGVMLTVKAMERMIAVELVGSRKTIRTGTTWLASFVPREGARQRAFRQVSFSRIKQLAIACLMFEDTHDHQWPESLEDLLPTGLLGDSESASQFLVVPYPVGQGLSPKYLYKPPTQTMDGLEPVIGEPRVHDGGACVGFADGHVEWVASPRAEQLLAALEPVE